jgi:hypothetical protein
MPDAAPLTSVTWFLNDKCMPSSLHSRRLAITSFTIGKAVKTLGQPE